MISNTELIDSEHSDAQTMSLRQRIFKILDKNHVLKAKELCFITKLPYDRCHETVQEYRQQWQSGYRNRQALNRLSLHKVRGWIYVLKSIDRTRLLEEDEAKLHGWVLTRARNGMLLFRDPNLGRLEWFRTGRVNFWIKKPASWGRVKQLLANGFYKNGLIFDIELFDSWADTARFKGAHICFDTGERLPYARVDVLKDSLGVVAKIGDVSHSTCLELEFVYPDWAERNERLFEQGNKMLAQNHEALKQDVEAMKQFSEFLQGLTVPKSPGLDRTFGVV
jgi:hypothetical protein